MPTDSIPQYFKIDIPLNHFGEPHSYQDTSMFDDLNFYLTLNNYPNRHSLIPLLSLPEHLLSRKNASRSASGYSCTYLRRLSLFELYRSIHYPINHLNH